MQANLNSGGSTAATSAGTGLSLTGAAATSDMFTKLLVAQIRNQDPLSPTDPSQFVNQLTQLSQMEALQNLVSQNTSNASVLDSLQVMALGAQVGSDVAVRSTSVTLGTDAVKGSFTLSSGSDATAVVLTDAAGKEHRIELGTRTAGEVNFSIDPASLGLPAGQYSLSVATSTKEAPGIDLVGSLQSVKLASTGDVVLRVAGVGDVSPSQVSGFLGRTTSQGS